MSERFASVPTVVAQLLGTTLAAPNRVGLAVPGNLTGLLPFVRVLRAGGPRDRLNDYARITVDVLDTDYVRGETLAQDIAELLAAGRLRFGAVVIDRVAVDTAPREVTPWAPGTFRFEAAYTVVSRRYRAA